MLDTPALVSTTRRYVAEARRVARAAIPPAPDPEALQDRGKGAPPARLPMALRATLAPSLDKDLFSANRRDGQVRARLGQ
jgi:hypothetical protein